MKLIRRLPNEKDKNGYWRQYWAESYTVFRDWALNNGYSEGLQIDRKNTNGNYELLNCHFVTPAENARNRRNNAVTEQIVKEIRFKYSVGNYKQK